MSDMLGISLNNRNQNCLSLMRSRLSSLSSGSNYFNLRKVPKPPKVTRIVSSTLLVNLRSYLDCLSHTLFVSHWPENLANFEKRIRLLGAKFTQRFGLFYCWLEWLYSVWSIVRVVKQIDQFHLKADSIRCLISKQCLLNLRISNWPICTSTSSWMSSFIPKIPTVELPLWDPNVRRF